MKKILLLFVLLNGAVVAGAQCHTPTLQKIGYLAFPGVTLAGCWHHVDATGREYALVGTSRGLSIVDLTNPQLPRILFEVPGLPNIWREVRTWGGFAYVGSEAMGSGITIVDLRQLPDTIHYKVWTGDCQHPNKITSSHTVQCEDGYLYIFGAGGGLSNGAIICRLDDPWNPQIVGTYSGNYLHDGFIRGDTLWGSEIYQGQFSVIDISDRSRPRLLAVQETPGRFNHNTWLSADGNYLFTTDERPDAPLASFRVSHLGNIELLDVYFPSGNPSREVHNVRGLGNFLVNPSYGGQLTIVDATHPDNLVEVGFASLGQSLVWDADPYLPSGLVIATAKNEGLYIFKVKYQQAAYLEGRVTDAKSGQPLVGATVTILNMPKKATSRLNGEYKTGVSQTGAYTVRFEKPGYETVEISGVEMTLGQTTHLDVALPAGTLSAKGHAALPTLRLVPSLVSDHLTLEIQNSGVEVQGTATIYIVNLNGQVVFETPLASHITRIEGLEALPAGNYWLRVQWNHGQCSILRFVKGG